MSDAYLNKVLSFIIVISSDIVVLAQKSGDITLYCVKMSIETIWAMKNASMKKWVNNNMFPTQAIKQWAQADFCINLFD